MAAGWLGGSRGGGGTWSGEDIWRSMNRLPGIYLAWQLAQILEFELKARKYYLEGSGSHGLHAD